MDSDGVHINTKAYIEPSNRAWMTPSDEIAQLLKFQIRAKRTSHGKDEETNCHSSSVMTSKPSVTSVLLMSMSAIASFSRTIKIEKCSNMKRPWIKQYLFLHVDFPKL